jgi:lipopolysaccharide biosynthesis glycosyltransferase
MNIVFCADRNVLQGLYVAAYSIMDHINPDSGETRISILSDELDDEDMKHRYTRLSTIMWPKCSETVTMASISTPESSL